MALKYHPDKCKTEECKEKLSGISEAYDCLSNDNKRRLYDKTGKCDDEGKTGNSTPKIEILDVTLEDLYNGNEIPMEIQRKEVCSHCHGTGAHDVSKIKKCEMCHGHGIITETVRSMGKTKVTQKTCPICHGTEIDVGEKCHVCHGNLMVDAKHTISVTVERGMKDGDEIVFENEGTQYLGQKARTIIVKLNQTKHELFTRKGDDLYITHKITLKEALLRWKHFITHLDGHTVKIGKRSITRNGEVLTLEGEGMPVHQFPSQKGNLFVTIQVVMPKKLTSKQLQDIEEYF